MILAEAHLAAGDPSRALEVVAATKATDREAGVVRLAALERIQGRALYEIALILDTLVDLDVRAGDLARAETRERECAEIPDRLGVRVGPGRRERWRTVRAHQPRISPPRSDCGPETGQGGPESRRSIGLMALREKTINGYRIEPFANLQGAQLQRARLGGMNLYCVNFRGADLSEADLRGAYLAESQLSGARMTACDMTGANLSGATLQRALLNGVDLSEANLRNADLSGAHMYGADLRGAKYCKTIMPDLRINSSDC